MGNVSEKVGARIRTLRKQADLTQQELAERAGVSYKYLGQIERGQVNLSVEKMVEIANGLNAAPSELLDDGKKGAGILSKARFILAELSDNELAVALDMLESLKRHSSGD
ncbi:helix-turn-helix transcriptional regulator [Pseudodesulfovibrio sp. zrk46]|uniref:helix-turn-helix domain-containing protein n=1 Tax=Pseudodesulfovibrio sp. zrk46 TaxID=2725288 RepID=UPI001449EDF7|nr:helix-turn-helix transcriptional regulator [Pseudodesulfovibrio sp. zrk46]QJB56537.1 helix-turn-helix transcriptional regulator [Pseudodesulfovibrio sp. zrk46]